MPRLSSGVMIVFPTNGTGTTGHLYAKKKKKIPHPCFTNYTKIVTQNES